MKTNGKPIIGVDKLTIMKLEYRQLKNPYNRPYLPIVTLLFGLFIIAIEAHAQNSCSLTLIPPSPVSEKITLSIRGAVQNQSDHRQTIETAVYLDYESDSTILYRETIVIQPHNAKGINFRWPAKGHSGEHQIIFTKKIGKETERVVQPITIIPSETRSVNTVDGAWFGFYHWSEEEGRLWNNELKKMSGNQWREQVKAMNEIGMNIIVAQEMFSNQMYVEDHSIDQDGYHGKAFYPSALYPGRMPITAQDPLEAIMQEADERRMHVFVGVGLYAWFDFTEGSLEWHKKIATELWNRYGHHPSFYGWYISEEVPGRLSANSEKAVSKVQQQEIVHFFKEFQKYVRTLAPDKPVILATNSYQINDGIEVYPKLLKYLDILCPFGFHRMPDDDVSGEEAALLLQKLCDDAGTHLWMDMEAFLFGKDKELYPRPIDGLISDLMRFQNFEKILCYQFPGLFNAPWASRKPGGEATVKLYMNYQLYYNKMKEK